MVKNQFDKKLKTLRIDNDLKLCNTKFDNFYKQKEIVRHITIKRTLQQNRITERINKTLMNKVKRMLISFGLAKGFWAEAIL